MKSKELIFCVVVLCSSVVVSYPYADDMIRQGAYNPQIAYNALRHYDSENIARPQNVINYENNYENQHVSGQELPKQWANNEYPQSFHQLRPSNPVVVGNNQVPINNFQFKPHQTQFVNPEQAIVPLNERQVEEYNVQNANHNYNPQQGWEAPQRYYPTQNNYQQVRQYQKPLIEEVRSVYNPIQGPSVSHISSSNLEQPTSGRASVEWTRPVSYNPVSTSVVTNGAYQPQHQQLETVEHFNNLPLKPNSAAQIPEVINPTQNIHNTILRRFAQQHEVDRITSIPEVQKALSSMQSEKRYVLVYPNGTVEHVESLDNVAEKHPNMFMANPANPLAQAPVTPAPILTTTLPADINPEVYEIGLLPYSNAKKNALHKLMSTKETPPTAPITTPATTIPSSSILPVDNPIVTLSPIEVPLDQQTEPNDKLLKSIKKIKGFFTTPTPIPLITEPYETSIITENPHKATPKGPKVPPVPVKTTTPIPVTAKPTVAPFGIDIFSSSTTSKPTNEYPQPLDPIVDSTAPDVYFNTKLTTTPYPTEAPEPVTEDSNEGYLENNYDDSVSTISPDETDEVTTDVPYYNRRRTNPDTVPAKPCSDADETLTPSSGKRSKSSKTAETIDEIDASDIKSTSNSRVWFRTTDDDMVSKLTNGNDTDGSLYVLPVYSHPQLERDTKTLFYPNGTVYEERVEIKWQEKEDVEPEVHRTFKVYNSNGDEEEEEEEEEEE